MHQKKTCVIQLKVQVPALSSKVERELRRSPDEQKSSGTSELCFFQQAKT